MWYCQRGNVGDIMAWAGAAASVEVSQTKDGKPQAILPDGTCVKGYPESKTAKGIVRGTGLEVTDPSD